LANSSSPEPADASEGDQGEDVGFRVLPGGVETGELGLAADELRAGDGRRPRSRVGLSPPRVAQSISAVSRLSGGGWRSDGLSCSFGVDDIMSPSLPHFFLPLVSCLRYL